MTAPHADRDASEKPMPHAHCPECLGAIGTHRTTCTLRPAPRACHRCGGDWSRPTGVADSSRCCEPFPPERVSYHHRDDGPWPYAAVLTTDQPDQPLPARLWESIDRLDVPDTRTQGLLDTIRHLEGMLVDVTAKKDAAMKEAAYFRAVACSLGGGSVA